jgi:hypothetical protein
MLNFLMTYKLICKYEHNQIESKETLIQSKERKTMLDFCSRL